MGNSMTILQLGAISRVCPVPKRIRRILINLKKKDVTVTNLIKGAKSTQHPQFILL